MNRWLAGSIPGWGALNGAVNPYQSRFLLEDGRVFFNSADSLVPQASKTRVESAEGHEYNVGVENVYEYEPQGTGSCQQAPGCISLISGGGSEQESGSGSEHESAFLDASANGENVFFVTSRALVSSDIDLDADIYDARVCTPSSPCVQPPPPPPPSCGSAASCHPAGGSGAPTYSAAFSSVFSGPGNLAVLPTKEGKSKKPTRAELLKKALASCRKRYKHAKHKRASCERQAKHKYGPRRRRRRKRNEIDADHQHEGTARDHARRRGRRARALRCRPGRRCTRLAHRSPLGPDDPSGNR